MPGLRKREPHLPSPYPAGAELQLAVPGLGSLDGDT